MVYIENDMSQTKLSFGRLDFGIPEDHDCRMIKNFVQKYYGYLDKEKYNKFGRSAFKKTDMLKIILFAYNDGIESPAKISENCKFNQLYQYVGNGIQPSERSIQRFIQENKELLINLVQGTVYLARDNGLTNFNHVAIDGTYVPANNSNYNVLNMKNIDLLIDLLENNFKEEVVEEKTKQLSRPALKIFKNPKKSTDEKLKEVKELKNELTKSGQTSIPINDPDARWMRNKKKQPQISYNIQSAVDYESKIIVSIDITQDPTDHHQLAKQIENIEKAIGKLPDFISADTGYHNNESLVDAQNKDTQLLIPTRKQSKEFIDKLNPNPYHKDHFKYDFENDFFICPENQKLTYHKPKNKKKRKKNKNYKPRRTYYTDACHNCPVKDQCTNSNVRVISEYGNELSKGLEKIMESEKAQKEYKKRMSTVEPPFGVMKRQMNLDKLVVKGIEAVTAIISLKAAVYNLKVIYNKPKGLKNNKKDLKNFSNFLANEFPKIKFSILIF